MPTALVPQRLAMYPSQLFGSGPHLSSQPHLVPVGINVEMTHLDAAGGERVVAHLQQQGSNVGVTHDTR